MDYLIDRKAAILCQGVVTRAYIEKQGIYLRATEKDLEFILK